jgi:hypothetical protein
MLARARTIERAEWPSSLGLATSAKSALSSTTQTSLCFQIVGRQRRCIDDYRTLLCIHHVAELLEVGEHAALRSRLVSLLTWLVPTTPV